MNTNEIEETLKELALKLGKGNDKQKGFGRKVHALALEIEKDRKESEKPYDAEMVKQIDVGKSRRPWPGRARKWPGR